MPLALRSLSDNRNRARVRPVGLRIRLRVCHLTVYFDWSLLTARDALTCRQRPLMVLKRTFVHTYVGGRKADLPREEGSTPEGKVNATAQNVGFLLKWASRRASDICCSPHRTDKYGTRPFYGGSGSRAVAHAHPAGSKNALGPVGIPLLGRLGRRAINPTLPKEVKAWGEGPLRPKDKFKIGKRRASGICYSPHLTSKCGTRPFFRWDRAQGRSPHAPGLSQKCPRPRRHSPF